MVQQNSVLTTTILGLASVPQQLLSVRLLEQLLPMF